MHYISKNTTVILRNITSPTNQIKNYQTRQDLEFTDEDIVREKRDGLDFREVDGI